MPGARLADLGLDRAAILIGNGFSRAYSDDLFDYPSLRETADFEPRIDNIFDEFDSNDFEVIMRRLTSMRNILLDYPSPDEIIAVIDEDIESIRHGLVEAISAHHPTRADVSDAAIQDCGQFLRQFDAILTTNYDLLLYWVLVNQLTNKFSDGFFGPGTSYAQWSTYSYHHDIAFIHGGLHLVRDRFGARKLTSSLDSITAQLSERLVAEQYPLFVAEGRWESKMEAIRQNDYLSAAYKRLETNGLPLIVYGNQLADQDTHLFRAIVRSPAPEVILTYYSPSGPENEASMQRTANRLRTAMQASGANRDVRLLDAPDIFTWQA